MRNQSIKQDEKMLWLNSTEVVTSLFMHEEVILNIML